jgi:hypothetical protein
VHVNFSVVKMFIVVTTIKENCDVYFNGNLKVKLLRHEAELGDTHSRSSGSKMALAGHFYTMKVVSREVNILKVADSHLCICYTTNTGVKITCTLSGYGVITIRTGAGKVILISH